MGGIPGAGRGPGDDALPYDPANVLGPVATLPAPQSVPFVAGFHVDSRARRRACRVVLSQAPPEGLLLKMVPRLVHEHVYKLVERSRQEGTRLEMATDHRLGVDRPHPRDQLCVKGLLLRRYEARVTAGHQHHVWTQEQFSATRHVVGQDLVRHDKLGRPRRRPGAGHVGAPDDDEGADDPLLGRLIYHPGRTGKVAVVELPAGVLLDLVDIEGRVAVGVQRAVVQYGQEGNLHGIETLATAVVEVVAPLVRAGVGKGAPRRITQVEEGLVVQGQGSANGPNAHASSPAELGAAHWRGPLPEWPTRLPFISVILAFHQTVCKPAGRM